ncbi:asparaginase [Salinibacterium sp. ZJ77]|uniref:asparaginase n=1 Tax=Salinibacterium sp. ZJ77 TaxID=2708337 RepID=UPI0014211396|nr:asparaginase [Salinibacterium sp. ZJ77]
MSAPLDAASSVELAVVERSGWPESRHLGAAVLLDRDGDVVASLGDPTRLIYPRSTLKLVQASAVQRLGVTFDPVATVLSTASHAGTPAHVAVVERMLADAGLTADALRCPAELPADPASRRDADAPARITMNCSGKHAAFLTAAVRHGWDIDSYLESSHPVQQAVARLTTELCGEHPAHWGVDGCGAPVPVVSLAGLARAASLTAREGTVLGDAIRAHAWAIDGPGCANTVTIERTGFVAKLGAEGVLVLVTPAGESVVVKSLDGSARATTVAGLELLVRNGLLDDAIREEVLAELGATSVRASF